MKNISVEDIVLALLILLALACFIIVLLIFNKVNVDFKGLNKAFKGLGQAIDSFSKVFDVPGMPWIIRVYLVLFVIFGLTMLFASVWIGTTSNSYSYSPGSSAASNLYSLSTDSLKLILGAILGSLSLAAEKTWSHGTGINIHNDEQQKPIEKEAKSSRNNPKATKRSTTRKKARIE